VEERRKVAPDVGAAQPHLWGKGGEP
jgi:hypothetical protein